MQPKSTLILAVFLSLIFTGVAEPGIIINGVGLSGGIRWDAAPRNFTFVERSLDGGLRYSMQGGSFEAYRDRFAWQDAAPTVSEFQFAVEQSFRAWESVDPVSGLGTDIRFVQDFGTSVVGNGAFGTVNFLGAEIDLFGYDSGLQNTSARAGVFFDNTPVTLTSGTSNYAGTAGIVGVDITMNNNPGAEYTLDLFRRILTHEIGHAIGLGDVEAELGPEFIDDNYDGSTSASALATITNSWAGLVRTAPAAPMKLM